MKIKLCGLFREEDAALANMAAPDYVGFVFAPSRRRVTPALAAWLRAHIRPEIAAVGVFADAAAEEVAALARSGVIQAAQLHGGEDGGYIARLKALTEVPLIRAVRMAEGRRIDPAGADMLLLDSGAGSGRQFDWTRIPPLEMPFFLAGGIAPGNVEDALRTGAWGLDVSSGVETDGVKDGAKMAALVRRVREASINKEAVL